MPARPVKFRVIGSRHCSRYVDTRAWETVSRRDPPKAYLGEEPEIEMRDHRWNDREAGFAEDICEPPTSTAGGYVLDDAAVASVIAHASRLIASSLEPIGRGLVADGDATVGGCGHLVRAAIQIDAVTALYRRLSRPPHRDVSIEDHCRALCCDLVLALGRLDITPRVAMCNAPLSPGRRFRLAILVVELMAEVVTGDAPRGGDTVWVTLKPSRDGWLELSVAGNFDPPIARPAPGPSRLETLVRVLSGELIPAAGSGDTIRVRFPLG